MFDLHLFRFEHRGDDIEVVSHGGTAEVYYRKNGGEPQNTYAMFKDDRSTFVSPEGKILGYADAVSFVRSLLWRPNASKKTAGAVFFFRFG